MDATPGAPLIQIRDVSRRYVRGVDEVHALERVSLDIPAGHFVGFMGPSGSGKSTLLNLVSGIDRPSEGDVIVAGQRLNDLSEDELARWRARHVGLIFQFFNLIPVLSARDNVALPLLLTKLDKAERVRRADTALRVVGLEERLDHYPRTLSGGEQQRVAIARYRHRPRPDRGRRANRGPRRAQRRGDPGPAAPAPAALRQDGGDGHARPARAPLRR